MRGIGRVFYMLLAYSAMVLGGQQSALAQSPPVEPAAAALVPPPSLAGVEVPPLPVAAPPVIAQPQTEPANKEGNKEEEKKPTNDNAVATAPVPTPTPAAPEKKDFSYGDSDLSILFLPTQIERMKSAIRSYESISHDTVAPVPMAPTDVSSTVSEIKEPLVYPVFYLASIVYHSPNDWSLWMSGRKITSGKNETDVSVLSISPNSATFIWRPSYSDTLLRRDRAAAYADATAYKNRLATSQSASLDKETGSIKFTLRENQTFVVGYFKIFEGFVESPGLAPLDIGATENANPQTTPLP